MHSMYWAITFLGYVKIFQAVIFLGQVKIWLSYLIPPLPPPLKGRNVCCFFQICCRTGHPKSLVTLEILGTMFEPQSKIIPGLSLI